MSPEKTKHLRETYPHLYRKLRAGQFECGNGWFDIIEALSRKVASLDVQAIVVKEKFGSLRFQVIGNLGQADDAINDAELLSMVTCENCGAHGKLRTGDWLRVRCDDCAATLCRS